VPAATVVRLIAGSIELGSLPDLLKDRASSAIEIRPSFDQFGEV
jgi:hypothetical protein